MSLPESTPQPITPSSSANAKTKAVASVWDWMGLGVLVVGVTFFVWWYRDAKVSSAAHFAVADSLWKTRDGLAALAAYREIRETARFISSSDDSLLYKRTQALEAELDMWTERAQALYEALPAADSSLLVMGLEALARDTMGLAPQGLRDSLVSRLHLLGAPVGNEPTSGRNTHPISP